MHALWVCLGPLKCLCANQVNCVNTEYPQAILQDIPLVLHTYPHKYSAFCSKFIRRYLHDMHTHTYTWHKTHARYLSTFRMQTCIDDTIYHNL